MKTKMIKKDVLESRLYPFKQVEQYPLEKRVDFLAYLTRKILQGEGDADDYMVWLKAAGELPPDFPWDFR